MITVLHGDDVESSYAKLSALVDSQKDTIKVSFGAKATPDQITQALQTQDLLNSPKLIVVENFLSPQKKLPEKFFAQIPKESTIIFWENKALTPAKITKLQKIATIQHFKKPTELFTFLDSLIPGSKTAFSLLSKLQGEDGLIWQIQNRFLLLSLVKLNIPVQTATQITKRQIAPWQWQRLESQSAKFSKNALLATFSASLKIDHLIKSGRTSLPAQTLIIVLLTKYLR